MSNNYSENEDEPAVYESSGEEWSENTEVEFKKRRSLRIYGRKTKNARPRLDSNSSTDENNDKDVKHKKRNAVNKKQKLVTKATDIITETRINNNAQKYSTGCFLIHKEDAQVGDRTKLPCIWRVDGKALLQKYEPFDDNGRTRHRTTSIYTGWSSLDQDLYIPIKVDIYRQTNNTSIVDVDWEQLRQANMDSD